MAKKVGLDRKLRQIDNSPTSESKGNGTMEGGQFHGENRQRRKKIKEGQKKKKQVKHKCKEVVKWRPYVMVHRGPKTRNKNREFSLSESNEQMLSKLERCRVTVSP